MLAVVHLSLTSCGLLLGSPKTLCRLCATQLPSTTLLYTQLTNTKHSWQNGTRCRDGVNVLWCCSRLVWLVFEGSIPTCACFHLKNFFVTCRYLYHYNRVFDYSFVNLLFDEENGSQIFGGGASRAADSQSTPCALCPMPSPRAQQHGHMGSESR